VHENHKEGDFFKKYQNISNKEITELKRQSFMITKIRFEGFVIVFLTILTMVF